MRSSVFLAIALASFGAASALRRWGTLPPIEVNRELVAITMRSEFVKFAALGMKRAVADLSWVHTLLESDLDHYAGTELRSWMYLRFKGITQLDPRFYEAYRFGGQYLMVVKDDLPGAEELMRSGLALFPDDYHLNWQLGFLFAIERSNPAESFVFFDRIKDHPDRPHYFDTFFGKIANQSFGPEEAFRLTLAMWEKQRGDDETRRRLYEQLYSLRAEIDLACLNAGRAECRRSDFDGAPYVRSAAGSWSAAKPLVKTKLRK